MKNETRSEITDLSSLSCVVFLFRAWTGLTGKISGLAFRLIFHRFSPFNCCLSVVLQLDKGDYPENLQIVLLSK